ncbi:unnamed protein product [Schistosoma mattheei]|uniref:Uncharacterized protein n=1 Tax=Schistosoma mattheei TaxID=31246 RepID=A0AA85BTK6_9TREM|nr:unnamed protein product [Schistosoma mattheei]
MQFDKSRFLETDSKKYKRNQTTSNEVHITDYRHSNYPNHANLDNTNSDNNSNNKSMMNTDQLKLNL